MKFCKFVASRLGIRERCCEELVHNVEKQCRTVFMESQFTRCQCRFGIICDRVLKAFVHHLGILTCPDVSCTKANHTSSFNLSCINLAVVVEKVVGCSRDNDRYDAMGGSIPSTCLGMILEVGQEQMKVFDFSSEFGSKGFATLLEQACSSPRG